MKIKKLLVLVSMLAVMFSFAGCDENYDKPFAYNDRELISSAMNSFMQYENISEDYVDYYLTSGTEFEKSAVKGIVQTKETDKVGDYEDFSETSYLLSVGAMSIEESGAKIVNGPDYVTVILKNHAENRDVEISVKYYENNQYFIEYNKIVSANGLETYDDFYEDILYFESIYGTENLQMVYQQYGVSGAGELYQMEIDSVISDLNSRGLYPYYAEEMVVSAVYSKKELVGQAGMNTLIGMGTVFVVLIFISFIISLFKYLPALFAKKPKVEVEKKAETPKAVATPVAVADNNENLADDSQLVAVITAAIYAYEAQSGNGAVSKDKLVVRSIKRVRK
ncbi:MAG: hypothetical protein E7257_05560 [Lachnospiraceae bacterium]|nr:hypothetical protein [Lachnospiraceae bacterium]